MEKNAKNITDELIIKNDDPDTTKIMLQNLIYTVRGQHVMMDSDLAALYQVETKRLNEAVKRNIERFPEKFRFQLTEIEYYNLKSQIATSSYNIDSNAHGGRRKLPYVFTEQGIAMLSAVLRSETAVQVSIRIMETFIEMRKYLANTSFLYDRLNELEIKQSNYQKETNEKFDQVFTYMETHKESNQKVFFEGQMYDAYSLIISCIKKANTSIMLVDNYVDVVTLDMLAKKKEGVTVCIYTTRKTTLVKTDIEKFNNQYPFLKVKYTNSFHDRFLIVDDSSAYHIGASVKDAGRKCFAITKIEDVNIVDSLIQRLK